MQCGSRERITVIMAKTPHSNVCLLNWMDIKVIVSLGWPGVILFCSSLSYLHSLLLASSFLFISPFDSFMLPFSFSNRSGLSLFESAFLASPSLLRDVYFLRSLSLTQYIPAYTHHHLHLHLFYSSHVSEKSAWRQISGKKKTKLGSCDPEYPRCAFT